MTPEPVMLLRDEAPAAPAVPAPVAVDGRVRVLQFGPALSVRGGVSSVEQLIMDYMAPYVSMRHVPTMEDGSALARAATFTRAVQALHQSLASIEPAIVHIHFASRGSTLRKMILAEMTSRARRPLVLHAHGAGFDTFHRKLPQVVRNQVNRILQRANVFIALSSQWRDFYINECELSPSQVTVLPNPVRVPAEVPNREGRTRVQFLFLGRIGERKGAFELLRAFAALPPEKRARASLVFAGDGDVEGLRAQAAPLGENVHIHGWIDARERDRLLAQSDVFALPSHAEGVPMSLLEAMASGLPAITTSVGGIPDVFRSGAQGLGVTPGDVDGIRAAMARMISDDAFRLEAGRRARERAQSHDVQSYARRLADIYQRIAPVAALRELP